MLAPDGRELAYFEETGDPGDYSHRDVFTMALDGSEIAQLTHSGNAGGDLSWSPDGRKLMFQGRTTRTSAALETVNSDGWQAIPGPNRGDYKNAATFCKAERAFWGDQFASRYGGGRSAYGKCVSGK